MEVIPIPAEGLLPDGIYFNLSEERYHADPALGSTSIKELSRKPCRWQYDRLRPRENIETEFLVWGRAWHCRVLEGADAFAARYAKPPHPDDYPNALVTTDDIKELLRQHGKKLTGNKPDLIARAKELEEECPPFFDDILAKWKAEHPGHTNLTDRQVTEIEDAVTNMSRDPILSSVMRAGSLIDGAAEVSIFWTNEYGIRCKARFDYALPPAGNRVKSLIVDLKSFTTFKGGNDEDAGVRKIYDECYDIQATHYMDAYRAAKKLLESYAVFGDAPNDDYLKSFLHADGVDWVWVMLRRDAGMVPLTISVDTADEMFTHAKRIVDSTFETYLSYVETWGIDQIWSPPPKMPLRLNKSFLPTYNRGVEYEQPRRD